MTSMMEYRVITHLLNMMRRIIFLLERCLELQIH